MHPLRTASNIQLQLEFVTASCKNTSGRETVLIWPHCPNWNRLLVPLTVSWTCQLNNNHFDVCFLHMLSRHPSTSVRSHQNHLLWFSLTSRSTEKFAGFIGAFRLIHTWHIHHFQYPLCVTGHHGNRAAARLDAANPRSQNSVWPVCFVTLKKKQKTCPHSRTSSPGGSLSAHNRTNWP